MFCGAVVVLAISFALFTMFFDEAVLVRRGTIYKVPETRKVVALTFDDGPSPKWTPQVLDELKKANVKATFFMIGMHVKKYPDIVRRVAAEGHEIENHTYDHRGLLEISPDDLKREILSTEQAVTDVVGVKTVYFRPPKAWITSTEKKTITALGYRVVLWTLNSKDWVTYNHKLIVAYLMSRVQPGDIILFHDSGGVFGTEGGDRSETVSAIPCLVKKLRAKGYDFVTVKELIDDGNSAVSSSL